MIRGSGEPTGGITMNLHSCLVRGALWLLPALAAPLAAAQEQRPQLSLAVSRALAVEGTREPLRIDLRLDRPAPRGGVCIDLDLAGGSAVAGEDFRVDTEIPPIPEGGTMAMVVVQILDDPRPEPEETLRIVLRPSPCYALGSPREVVVTIRDDDDDPAALAQRLQQLIAGAPNPLLASQLANLGDLCATNRPPPGSELDRRCQLLRLALRDPAALQQLVQSLRGVIGEEFSSQRRGFRMLAGTQLGAIGRRLEAVRGGAGAGVALVDSGIGTGTGFLPLAANVAEDGELLGRGIGLFASFTVGDGSREGSTLENGYDSESNVFLVGIDKRLDANWVLGLAWSRTGFEADLSDDSGLIDLDADALNLYLSRSFERGWLDGSLGLGRGELQQTRVARFEGQTGEASFSIRDVLRGRPDVELLTASLSAGYDWQRGAASFGPRLALEYSRFEIEAFEEAAIEGSDAFAVALEEQRVRSLLARLGGGAQWALSTRAGVLLPQLELYWVAQFEDDADVLSGRFLNDPLSRPFQLPTEGVDARYGEVAASLGMQFVGGWSGYFSYRRLFNFQATEQDYWSLGLRREF
jgi:outer membrane autotransporter protein